MNSGQFKPGESGNPSGRRKGSKNHVHKVKQGFIEAFEEIGGVQGLVSWIEENPTNRKDFYKMLVQILPREFDFNSDPEDVKDMSDAQLLSIVGGDNK